MDPDTSGQSITVPLTSLSKMLDVGKSSTSASISIKPPKEEDQRRYSSTSSITAESSAAGYTKVYSSSPSSTFGIANLNKTPNKPFRKVLTPPEKADNMPERPSSPRDIAKAFEAKSKENPAMSLGARNQGSSIFAKNFNNFSDNKSRASNRSISSTSNDKNNADRRTSSPEIINPLKEFTNYASKMMNNDFEEPGPFNFQGMLRKTNSNIRNLETQGVKPSPIIPVIQSVKSAETASSETTNKLSKTAVLKPTSVKTIEKEEEPESGHWLNKAYPLPGMISKNDDNTSNNKKQSPKIPVIPKLEKPIISQNVEKGNKKIEDIMFGPGGIVFDGIVEDL